MTPSTATGRAARTSPSSAARSPWVAPSTLRARSAAPRDDIQPELAVWQGPAPLLLGPVRLPICRAGRGEAAPDAQGEAVEAGERGHGAAAVVGHMRRAAAVRAAGLAGLQEALLR